jgi:hypothetical protein
LLSITVKLKQIEDAKSLWAQDNGITNAAVKIPCLELQKYVRNIDITNRNATGTNDIYFANGLGTQAVVFLQGPTWRVPAGTWGRWNSNRLELKLQRSGTVSSWQRADEALRDRR